VRFWAVCCTFGEDQAELKLGIIGRRYACSVGSASGVDSSGRELLIVVVLFRSNVARWSFVHSLL